MRKSRIRGFCCANLGTARNLLGSRNQTLAIRGNKPTIDHTRLRARSIVGSLTRMAELLCVRDRSWVCCRGWPRFGCAILEDCVLIKGDARPLSRLYHISWVVSLKTRNRPSCLTSQMPSTALFARPCLKRSACECRPSLRGWNPATPANPSSIWVRTTFSVAVGFSRGSTLAPWLRPDPPPNC